MSNTKKLIERVLSGACNMGWISDAEAEEIRALAATASGAAVSGEREKFEAWYSESKMAEKVYATAEEIAWYGWQAANAQAPN